MRAGTSLLMPGSARDRILQLLEIDGGWMTLYQVEADFAMRWPDTNKDTINRAFHRLADTGMVAKRKTEHHIRRGWNGVHHVTELRRP